VERSRNRTPVPHPGAVGRPRAIAKSRRDRSVSGARRTRVACGHGASRVYGARWARAWRVHGRALLLLPTEGS